MVFFLGAEVDFSGRAIPQRLMGSPIIIIGQVTAQARSTYSRGGILVEVDLLIFDRSPETFRKDIVHRPSPTVHADGHITSQQPLYKLGTGEMTPLIAVADGRNGFL